MGALSLFIIFLIYLCGSYSKRAANEGPQISVRDGHLIITSYTDKNIKFKTSSDAAVTINDIDVLPVLRQADKATKFYETYQTSYSSVVDRVGALEQRVLYQSLNGTSSAGFTDQSLRIRRLNRRLTAVQRTVISLKDLLLMDECASNPCKNGGVCQDLFNNYLCRCPNGWEGQDCSEDVNECTRFAGTDLGCQNGATCINKLGTYECLCPTGFLGIHCTRKTADCNTGGVELCGHGICVAQNTAAGFKCICEQGWTTDSNGRCIVDVDECNQSHPSCSTNPLVKCLNTPGSFYCAPCPQGYTGNGYYCADINECDIFNGLCSMNPMVNCLNTPGSRICGPCPVGYYGDGVTCSFRGVCNVDNGGCHPKAQCRDNPSISSTYVECTCPPGYIGSGIGPNGCVLSPNQFHPCTPNPCVNGDCTVAGTGGYTCKCRGRYVGRNCDILSDPCASNPCLNGGTCQNLGNIVFKCICQTGYVGARCDSQTSGCGGKLRDENGTLKYPPGDYAAYDNSVSCAWTIAVNDTKVIKITFKKVDIEKSPGCRSDLLQIHDGANSASRFLGRFCGNELPLGGNITSTHNIIYLWFRSDSRNAKGGFELTWNSTKPACGGDIYATSHGSIESPGSPGVYPPNRDCYWKLEAPVNKRLVFHFFSLAIGQNPDCEHDYLEFSTGLSAADDTVFAKFCNSSRPAPFHSLGSTTVVHFHSDAQDSYPGFQLTYSVTEGIPGCGGTYTSSSGTIESIQPVRGNYEKVICEYKIQQPLNMKLRLTFLSFDIVDFPGCKLEYLEIREGLTPDSPLIDRYCGNNLPPPLMSFSNQLIIISTTSKSSQGWKLSYEAVCGTKFTNVSGEFKSPPQRSNTECIYHVQRPRGYKIELVLKVTTPAITSCFFGFVEVRDGDSQNSTLIGSYCRTTTEVITSTHNSLWIRYVQKGLPNYMTRRASSFEASYTSTDTGCGGILRDKIGNVASPSQPEGYYPPKLKCSWVIIAPPRHVVQLTWITFSLEPSYECSYDNVQVFDNNTGLGTGDLMGKFCGSTLPRPLQTISNIMTIVFTTDVTIHMEGFLASYIFIPESNVCGGNYYTSSGVIKTPKYPKDYPTNLECTWTITVRPGQQILLNVTDFSLELYSGCRYDWLEIRNGGTAPSPLIGRYCGTDIPKQIPSHTNQLYLYFRSDMSRNGRGFRITWSSTSTGCGGLLTSPKGSIISPHYPEPYSTNTECIWKITVSAGSRIQMVFSDIDLEKHSLCIADYVQIYDGLTTNTKSLGKFCSEASSPVYSTENQALVKFRSDVAFQGRGFRLHYSTVCNNTVSGFRGVIESPNFPNPYSQDLNCLWNIVVSDRNKINITFSHFELERSLTYGNSCTFDFVEIQYQEYQNDPYMETDPTYVKVGKYCGTQNPGLIPINSDHAQIHFVTDRLLVGSGFRLEWQIDGCGGILKRGSGTIQSPNYPKGYPDSVKCEWQIQVDYGHSIQIEFIEVDIERESSCGYDAVTIYNGPDNSSNVIAKVCQQRKPITVSSTGNFMFIEFKADYSYQGKGFVANYSTNPTNCGGRFTAPLGSIVSPNYPKNYNKNDTCEYLIEIEEGHSIELDFEDLDLLENNCDKNYVKVHDGPTAAYPVLATACGSHKPNETIHSTYNEMYIEFRSHAYYTTKGFSAKYRKACGSRITTQGSGIIDVTRNEFLEHITSCTWTIVSSDPSRHVSLIITHIDLLEYYCYEDNMAVNIYGGESTDSPLIKGLCGNKVPPPIISSGSAITIELSTEMDFSASYSVLDSHCGGTYTSSEGYFSTPGYPQRYAADMQCEWIVKTAPGNHLSLSFSYFELIESDRCNTDYLEIRSNNASGKLLGVYCGKNKPENITHEGTLWMLYKSSKLDQDTTITAKGFYGEYSLDHYNELSGPKGVIASPTYPSKYNVYGTFSWKITVATRQRVRLTFKEFYVEKEEDDCFYTSFTVYDGVDETAPLLKTLCGRTIPEPMQSTSNVIFIKVAINNIQMGTMFMFEWLQVSGTTYPGTTTVSPPVGGCGSSETIDINGLRNYTVVTSPGYPGGYKPNLNCEWIFSTIPMNHLRLYIMDMDLQNDRCTSDYLVVYQKHSYDNDWEQLRTICSREESNEVIATDLLKLKFVSNSYLNGTGFKAYVYEDCGGAMFGPSGYIVYDNSTPVSYECQWNITVRPGRTIELSFEEINIPAGENGNCNSFIMVINRAGNNFSSEISDGHILVKNGKFSDSPLLGNGKYCGRGLGNTKLNSTGNYLYIKYKGSTVNVRFKLKYQEISFACGREITLSEFDRSVEISSPNYPSIPSPHSECIWLIRAPADQSLRIDFEERFDLTTSKNCKIDYVELRNGGTEYSQLIGKYCKSIPSTQFSTDNMLFVKFFTDTDEPRNGFKAKVSLAYCGGTIRSNEGIISSPLPQSGSQKINCTWNIVGPLNHYLTLEFTKIQVRRVLKCLSTNMVVVSEPNIISNTEEKKLGQYCGSIPPAPFTTSSNKAIINFVGGNNDQFVLKFNASQSACGGTLTEESGVISSPGYPGLNHLSRQCIWIIKVPQGRRVTLEIVDLDLDTGPYGHSQGVAIYDGYRYMVRNAFLRSGDPKAVYESSSNVMTVMFWASQNFHHRGFKARFTSNNPTICKGDFNADNGIISQPSGKNTSYWCHWEHNSRKVNLDQTLALTISYSTNATKPLYSCKYNSWAIHVTYEEEKPVIASLCAVTEKNHIVRSPFPTTKLEATAARRIELNFTVSYIVHECGGIVRGEQGFISSPNYPSKPTKSVECVWQLKVDQGQMINLTTIGMNLGDDCEKNYLLIHNGDLPTHPRIGEYCKDNKPDNIIAQSNSLWIEYKWDSQSTGTGFKFQYEAIEQGCGGIFHDKTRIIQTPNYEKDYPNNAECLWEIRSEPGYSIRLNFIGRFHIEDSQSCKNDYLEILDWKLDKWVSTQKICGRNIPQDVKSTGDRLRLLFRSNNAVTASGFKAIWDWECGGTFEAVPTPRYIVSPGYPVAYSKNLKCVYNITASFNKIINVRFDDFEIEQDASICRYDNVTISGRYSVFYSITRRVFCGTNKPQFMRTRENVIITFKTDAFINKKGFKFMYNEESCGEEVTTEKTIEYQPVNPDTFSSATYRYYIPRVKCIWKITAPSKKMAVLKVTKLDMIMSPMCFGQSVNIYNGLDEEHNIKLASLCGNIKEELPITAEGGKMLIRLDTNLYNYGGFTADVYFSHGPAEGCGGSINLTETKSIRSPNLADLDCHWKIIAPRDHQVLIEFTEINIPASCTKVTNASSIFCKCAFIEVRDGAGPTSESMGTLCSSDNSKTPIRNFTSSSNAAFIRFFLTGERNDAFKATLTPVPSVCGPSMLNVTNEIQTITTPNYPNKYPSGIKCNWVFNSRIIDRVALHFTDFDLMPEHPYHIQSNTCSGDKVLIIEDPNRMIISEGLGPNAIYQGTKQQLFLGYNDINARHVYCGKEESPFDYYSTGKSLTLSFISIYSENKGKGFKLEYSLAGCNRNYTDVQGRIVSNTNRETCLMTITVPENYTISIYFSQLFLPYSINCTRFAFEIRDGSKTGTELLRACGYRLQNPVFSYTNKVYINIKSTDSAPIWSRYDFSYTSTDKGRGCGGELYNYRGRLTSPLYPKEYRNDSVCIWNVRVPLELHAVLKFTTFDIQGSCVSNYVKVTTYSDGTPTDHVFCKDDNPAILRSDSRIRVEYSSSLHNGGTGWNAQYQGVSSDTTKIT